VFYRRRAPEVLLRFLQRGEGTMKSIRKIINIAHLVSVVAAMAFLITLVVIIFVHVVLRYVFNSGISWSEEVASRILIPAFVFLGMAMGVEEDLHININILPRKMPSLLDNSLTNLKYLCTIFIGVVLVYYGVYLVNFQNQFGVVLPATQWPSSLQFIILPVAGGLIIFISILNILKIPRDEKYIDRIIGLKDED
jgi:TRAP-type C4-dicarboxylate transport system permease small subunit